jgi:CRP-like cAMP-binding protein
VTQSPNRLLALLPAKSFAALQPHLKLAELVHETVLGEAGSEIEHVYFPHSGVISLVVELTDGDMIETAMVGCDGVLNAAAALDGQITLNKAIVQLPGFASTLPASRLRSFCEDNEAFQSILIRHDQVLFAQSQQSAACNASHSVEARMCRWLLRMRDLAESDDLILTQEFLAQMLGVRRPSVSIVANTLQKAGLIKYRRGHIRVLDLAGLREGSCECYGTVKAHYDGLLSSKNNLGADARAK